MSAMHEEILTRVRAILVRSKLLRAVASVHKDGGLRRAFGGTHLRPLTPREVAGLKRLGNVADDWARVRVAEGFEQASVRGCRFHGDVALGRFAGSVPILSGLELPTGVYDSTLANCVIGHGALMQNVRLLSNYVVGAGAVLVACGTVACECMTTFGNGVALRLGPETGGREVPVFAEIDVAMAAAVAQPGCGRGLVGRYRTAVAEYQARATSLKGIIERGARVRATADLRNTYVGSGAILEGATTVSDCTLLSTDEEPVRVESGACVSGSLLQWGSRVSTLAVVQRSVLTEHASVERHGKVMETILGPNTAVAAGEVTSCLVGPLVGCHHQSLLIATLWPEGRGNVAYGASIGCNHTSRAPDQECWVGEGVFFGLGVNVKFPADFSRAPYTVIACGLTLPPQRVTFPFSLLTAPATHPGGISPAYHEIIPAWVLAENWFALERTEAKLHSRDKGRRAPIDHAVLRPQIVDLICGACRRLEEVQEVREVYTEHQIPGLGKNFLRESSRRAALEAYRFAISLYALLGLKDRVQEAIAQGRTEFATILEAPADDSRWEHQRRLLVQELGVIDAPTALGCLPSLLRELVRKVTCSLARDGERGPRIIPDYAEVHSPVDQNSVVVRITERVRRLQAELASLLLAMGGGNQGDIARCASFHVQGDLALVSPV
jgi:hypothetical protein